MFECGECGDRFWDREEFEWHMTDEGHWFECETCTRVFANGRYRAQHMNAVDHWLPRVPCDTCDLQFTSIQAANRHMQNEGHWANYCEDCNRVFPTQNALRMVCGYLVQTKLSAHVDSETTLPAPKFQSVSSTIWRQGLVRPHHPSIEKLSEKMCLRADKKGLFTNRQLEWHGDDTEYIATAESWNGDRYECYLCHRGYGSLRSLNQHLRSPAHQQKVYHCPNRGSCSKQFTTLASLFNHLESESCRFMRFEDAQRAYRNVGDSLMSGRQLTMF
ncbi:hypothetical protein N7468_005962 [Penicillium chermesinum]|uniref:C2H2-type domain-containing protein n=1 Tax=Penicillium chermesinum TaxID=63820 RepID=A0A9W9P0K5_9EURO|nr:uncharacterized protein N7468_005962 [Penicillium chermesinum]KAJ5233006.1 hypothetical protein N7468_005962 [Penicillium chermesinum]